MSEDSDLNDSSMEVNWDWSRVFRFVDRVVKLKGLVCLFFLYLSSEDEGKKKKFFVKKFFFLRGKVLKKELKMILVVLFKLESKLVK